MVVQRSITACGPMVVRSPRRTSSPITANGPTTTPSASFAVGCTIARGSIWIVTSGILPGAYQQERLAIALQRPTPCPQTLPLVHARPDRGVAEFPDACAVGRLAQSGAETCNDRCR